MVNWWGYEGGQLMLIVTCAQWSTGGDGNGQLVLMVNWWGWEWSIGVDTNWAKDSQAMVTNLVNWC